MSKIEDSTKEVQEYIDKVTENGWYKPKGCEFCNSRETMECGDTDVLIIKTKEEGASLWFVDDKKRFREFMFITYCPICGKKL